MAAINLAVIEGPSGFNKLVVLKQILPEFAQNADIVGMFLDEARLAARLSHTNVVQTNEVGFEDDCHFIAMEFLDGQPLTRVLRRLRNYGGLPLAMHLQIIADLLAGLHYAHELTDYDGSPLGVVHCDVSPQNTFVTYEGVVKVVDFGVAKASTSVTELKPGIIKGKLAYMPAEQLRGEDLDRRADIFAVGVMLWEAATGKRPWRGLSDIAIVDAMLAGHFPAPCSANPSVPVELEAIILKALSHDRDSRYATAAELQAALEGYLETLGGRVAPREIGKLIASHFAAERHVLMSLIEKQLHVRATALPGDSQREPIVLPTIVDEDRDTPSPVSPAGVSASTRVEGAPTAEEPARGPMSSSPPLETDAPPPAPRNTRAKRHTLAAAIALAVATVGLMSFWQQRSLAQTSVTASGSIGSIGSAAPAAPTTVHVQLAASPAQARFFLDDVQLEGNPYQGDLALDGQVHRVRVEAPGFVPREENVTLDRNTFLDIELASETVAATPAKTPKAREASRPRTSSVAAPPQRGPVIVEW